jgi:hypothetical protein
MSHRALEFDGHFASVTSCDLNATTISTTLKTGSFTCCFIRGCIQKFADSVDDEINDDKHSLRSNTKRYGGKTH